MASSYALYSDVWSGWVSSTASSSVGVWQNWQTAANTTYATADYQQVWVSWLTDGTGATHSYRTRTQQTLPRRRVAPQVREPTAEELRIAEERRVEYARVTAEKKEAWAAATLRSLELLRMLLDEDQLKSFERSGWFDVHVGERTYRLGQGQPMLIKGEDKKRYTFCIHPRETFPKGDELATLKLMIEANEKQFLSTANASRLADAA